MVYNMLLLVDKHAYDFICMVRYSDSLKVVL